MTDDVDTKNLTESEREALLITLRVEVERLEGELEDMSGEVRTYHRGLLHLASMRVSLLEQGGKWEVDGLYEEGRRVKAKLEGGHFGSYWILHEDEVDLVKRHGSTYLGSGRHHPSLKALGVEEAREYDYVWFTGDGVQLDCIKFGDEWGQDAVKKIQGYGDIRSILDKIEAGLLHTFMFFRPLNELKGKVFQRAALERFTMIITRDEGESHKTASYQATLKGESSVLNLEEVLGLVDSGDVVYLESLQSRRRKGFFQKRA